jgi:hypothetical protein
VWHYRRHLLMLWVDSLFPEQHGRRSFHRCPSPPGCIRVSNQTLIVWCCSRI